MNKIALLISVICVLQGCKDDELPEQGHSGPTIDVQRNVKESISVQNMSEITSMDSQQNYNMIQPASIVQTSHIVPEGPVIPVQHEKQEMKKK